MSLARRIWFSHQRLVILRLKDPVARLYAFVYNLIRNAEISSQKALQDENLVFNISIEELKKMCGLSRIHPEKIEPFIHDNNLILAGDAITVKRRKYIEDKISYLKNKVGQISAELV